MDYAGVLQSMGSRGSLLTGSGAVYKLKSIHGPVQPHTST